MEGITISVSKEKSEELFYNALCGAGVLAGYGLAMKRKEAEYKKAKADLAKEKSGSGVCLEDIWMKILRNGGSLALIDLEDDDNVVGSIVLNDVHERVQKTPAQDLLDAINENGDGRTDDVILQTVFLGDVVYG
jgi:hypothetical protein